MLSAPRGRPQPFGACPQVQGLKGATNPAGNSAWPAGSSTNPSVPTNPAKSPEEFTGAGVAMSSPRGPLERPTGRRAASLGLIETGAEQRARREPARVVEGREHVPVEAGVGRHRVAREREHGGHPAAQPKPEGLAGPLRHALEDLADSLAAQLRGQEVELPLRDAPGDEHDVVLRQDVPEHVLDLMPEVAQVEPVGAGIARLDQRGPQRVVVAAAHLVRRDEGVDLDQLVAGRDDRDLRRVRDGEGRVPAGGRDRDFAPGEPDSRAHDDVPPGVVRAAAVHVPARGRRRCLPGHGHPVALAGGLLVGNDAVRALGQHRAGHDLDARVLPLPQREGPHAGGLRRLHPEDRVPIRARRGAQRVAVHRHAVERRQVAVGPEVGAKHPAVRLRDRAVFPVKERDRVQDQPLGACRCEHPASVAQKSLLAKVTI
jgi:hypothetical protein